MGNQSLGGGRGEREWMRGHVVAMGVANDRARSWLARIEPEPLVRQVDAAIPENGVDGHGRGLLGGGRPALEELVAQRAIGAEPLPGWPGEDAGAAAGRASLLRVGFRRRGRHLHQGQHLDRFHSGCRFAFSRLDYGRGWCC